MVQDGLYLVKGATRTSIGSLLRVANITASMALCSATAIADVGNTSRTMCELTVIQVALERFYSEYGRYPRQDEGLPVLFATPQEWNEEKPWAPSVDVAFEKLRLNKAFSPIDFWGHPYVYFGSNRVCSFGPDGISLSGGNDADDICNWERDRHTERLGPGGQASRWRSWLWPTMGLIASVMGILLLWLKRRRSWKRGQKRMPLS